MESAYMFRTVIADNVLLINILLANDVRNTLLGNSC